MSTKKANRLKLFSATFMGHYPVGACAVIFAENKQHALNLLIEDLTERELIKVNLKLGLADLSEIPSKDAASWVILDGEY